MPVPRLSVVVFAATHVSQMSGSGMSMESSPGIRPLRL